MAFQELICFKAGSWTYIIEERYGSLNWKPDKAIIDQLRKLGLKNWFLIDWPWLIGLQIMNILCIFIFEHFFLGLTSLWKSRQSVSPNISLSLTMINSEVILQKFLGPADLTKTLAFYIYELIKVIIVSKNENLVFSTS